MDVQRIVGRLGGRGLLWCTLGAALALGPGTASAQGATDACGQLGVSGNVNNCQNQVQAPVSYKGWETKSWTYYCGGDHPFFVDGIGGWRIDNSQNCWTGTENPIEEHSNFDGSFTNWCVDTRQLVVTLACGSD